MTIGEKICLARKKKGMNQQDLAGLLNVDVKTINEWEEGKSLPTQDTLFQISNMLDTSSDYLLENLNEISTKRDNELCLESTTKTIKKINKSKYLLIKVFMVLGCIFTPLIIGGSTIHVLQLYSLMFLILYIPLIPICCVALYNVKHSKNKNEVIIPGIISMFFISFIGGIIILSISDMDYEDYNSNIKKEKKLKYKKTIQSSNQKKLNDDWIQYYKNMCATLINDCKTKLNSSKITEEEKEEVKKILCDIQPEIDNICYKSDYERIKSKIKEIENKNKN